MSNSMVFLHPKPGAKVQVIGAGLPRTGTNSFCAALSILLDGPPYHAGVQYGTGTHDENDESHIKTLIDVCSKFPFKSQDEKNVALSKLENLLDGYVATADSGLQQLVPELMELYPDAKVICTTRDPSTWTPSMLQIIKTAQPRLAGFIFYWIPSIRHIPKLAASLSHIHRGRYGLVIEDEASPLETMERHYKHLEEVVPKEKLVWYNVKDGWEPLCKALGKPIPNVPFPRVNEKEDIERHFKKLAMEGLKRWAIASGIGIALGGVLYALCS